ncbi:MAG: serine/threonine protein kinase, partial [Candidatus Margulisbacteria bacterium]|nr:serine/threonine protein kinase [Candidatus Margulisiibacteriota bacterium]
YLMEHLEGKSLDQRISVDGKFKLVAAIDVMVTLLQAFKYIHKEGIVHRDIKPDNILWTNKGEVKIFDFGISRADTRESQLTMVGTALGTPGYMAPEQMRGDRVGYLADIFSLGIVFWEMLTKNVPIPPDESSPGEGAVVIASRYVTKCYKAFYEGVLPKIADNLDEFLAEEVFDFLQNIFGKMLAFKPADRYCPELEGNGSGQVVHDLIIRDLLKLKEMCSPAPGGSNPPPTPDEQPNVVI